MTVRLASEQDADDVILLIRRIPSLPQWHREALAVELPGGSAEAVPLRRLLVATGGGTLLGFAQISVLLGEAELESMAVDPAWRSRGVGRRLLENSIDTAQAHGATALRLEVRRSNQAALGLYRSAGMKLAGERRAYYVNPVEDALLMQLSWGDGAS